jgi:hypothetical protein
VFHGGGFPSHMAADDAVLFVAVMPRHSKLVSFHHEMRLKWEQGARRPWVRVSPPTRRSRSELGLFYWPQHGQ